MPPEPALRLRLHDGAAGELVAHVSGELDIASAPLLLSGLQEVLDRPGATVLVLDLGELQFADVAGLGAVLRVERRLTAHGGRVLLRSVSPLVRRVIEVLRLSERLPVEDSADQDSTD